LKSGTRETPKGHSNSHGSNARDRVRWRGVRKNVLLGVRAWDIFMFVRVRIEYKAVAVRTMRRKNGNGKMMTCEKRVGAMTELLRKCRMRQAKE
jgi:hypothetical protein